jgi:hypothetical protein
MAFGLLMSAMSASREAIVRTINLRAMLAATLLTTAAVGSAWAGDINVKWDAVSGAAGYTVYYGVQSQVYTGSLRTSTNSATITGLQDCQDYFVAVKAYNSAGESPYFSNELKGWSRPSVASATPSSAMQGDQIVMDIMGANFQDGAVVDLGNPHVALASVTVLNCNHIQLLATVEPTARAVHAAKIGSFDLAVANPDSVFGAKTHAFQVLVNPARFDINQSDATTKNRIDGKDTVYLSRQFGLNESNPNYAADDDFNGDGWVDGDDLAYIASNLGRCWSPSTKSWSLSACPAGS